MKLCCSGIFPLASNGDPARRRRRCRRFGITGRSTKNRWRASGLRNASTGMACCERSASSWNCVIFCWRSSSTNDQAFRRKHGRNARPALSGGDPFRT